MTNLLLGIGTNMGDREKNLTMAVERISKHIGAVLNMSSAYETEPWGFTCNNDFLNMAVAVSTDLEPGSVIKEIRIIETSLGRVAGRGEEYTSRVIDIDILLLGDTVLDEKGITIPHPLLHKRRFVLVPLCEIAAEIIHPVINKSLSVLLKECRDTHKVTLHSSPPGRDMIDEVRNISSQGL